MTSIDEHASPDAETPPPVGRDGLIARLKKLPPPVIYTISIVVTNAMSFITMPLMTFYVDKAQFGQFDVALALVEGFTLIAGIGAAHQLIRFASTADSDREAADVASELLGVALIFCGVLSVLVQLLTIPLMAGLDVKVDPFALRMMLLSGTVAACVELPLMWIRLKDRAWHYLAFAVGRAVTMVVLLWIVLSAGYGVTGLMISNASVMLAGTAVLVFLLWRETGVKVSIDRFYQAARYGAPIVGAALCMFALGNVNRLFMSGEVADAVIAEFGLAQRFAIAVFLVYAPFELWWMPKRIALLKEKDGYAQSAEYWGLGVAILLLGAAAISLTAPIFIELALRDQYHQSSAYIPALIGATVLAYIVMLSNVGAYAREDGYAVLMVDAIGAGVAILGYIVLVPLEGALGGAVGALIAMFAGNFTRLGLYVVAGLKSAPIRYPWERALIGAAAAALVIWGAPDQEQWLLRFGYSVIAGLALLGVMFALRLMRPVEEPLLQILGRLRDTRG
ncbi:MAG: oligosaccharide flippase family protein [Neomegalonema sp.]|nr:oligosaccharide flippase family protein [Neomegalonema sp.]